MATKKQFKDIQMMLSNPYYCMTVDPIFSHLHGAIIDEETFIKSGVNLIKEIGAEDYLRALLENLKGNYYSEDGQTPAGYKSIESLK